MLAYYQKRRSMRVPDKYYKTRNRPRVILTLVACPLKDNHAAHSGSCRSAASSILPTALILAAGVVAVDRYICNYRHPPHPTPPPPKPGPSRAPRLLRCDAAGETEPIRSLNHKPEYKSPGFIRLPADGPGARGPGLFESILIEKRLPRKITIASDSRDKRAKLVQRICAIAQPLHVERF